MEIRNSLVLVAAIAACGSSQSALERAAARCPDAAPLLQTIDQLVIGGELARALRFAEEADRACREPIAGDRRERVLAGLGVDPPARRAFARRLAAAMEVEALAAAGDFGAPMRRSTAALRSSQAELDAVLDGPAFERLSGESLQKLIAGALDAEAGREARARASLRAAGNHPIVSLHRAELEARSGRAAAAARLVSRALFWTEWRTGERATLTRLDVASYRIGTLVVSSDGRRLLIGTNAGFVLVIDIDNGQLIHVLEGHTGPVTAAAFSRAGRLVLSGSYDGTVRLWELTGGTTLRELAAPDKHQVHHVAFDASDRQALVLSGPARSQRGTLGLWNLVTGKRERAIEGIGVIQEPQLTGDRAVIAGTAQEIEAWDLASGQRRWKRSIEAAGLAIDPDNRIAVSSRDWSSGRPTFALVRLDPATGAIHERKSYPKLEGASDLTFFEDRNLIGVGGFRLRRLALDTGEVTKLDVQGVFGPGGRVVVGLASDSSARRFVVLDGKSGDKRSELGVDGADVAGVVFHPTRPALVVAGETVSIWELGGEVQRCPGPGAGVAIVHPAGGAIALGGGGKPLRLVDDRTCVARHALADADANARPLAFTPDGSRLLVAGFDYPEKLRLFDTASGQQIRELGHRGTYVRAFFSADASRVTLVDRSGTATMVDTASGERSGQSYASFPDDLVVAGDGRGLVVDDSTFGSVDLEIKEPKIAPIHVHPTREYSGLALSPDGSVAALVGEDGVIDLVEVESGASIASIGPFSRRAAVVFSADGERLAINAGHRLELWSAVGRRVGILYPSGADRWLAVRGDRVDGSPIAIGAPSRFRWQIGSLTFPAYIGWSRGRTDNLTGTMAGDRR